MSAGRLPLTPRRIAVITAAIVCALLVGWLSVTKSLGLALASRAPDVALKFDPANAQALSQLALREIQTAPVKGRDRAVRRAQAAIARDATAAVALSVVGLARRDAQARRALIASERLSRRVLPTQLALIEEAVSRNDVPAALNHYDIALRTSHGAPSILFPVLVGASTDRSLLPELARMIRRGPDWGPLYLQQLAQVGPEMLNVAWLFRTLIADGYDPGPLAMNAVYPRLLELRLYDQAWAIYAARNRGARRAGVRNGDFVSNPDVVTPFDWNVNMDGPVRADIVPGERREDGRLSFESNIGEGGLAARQLVLLAPGRHMLTAMAYDVKAPDDAWPYFRVECAFGGEIARLPLPRADARGQRGRWSFTVPRGCGGQWLSINLQPPATSEVITGAIGSVRLQ